MAKTKKDCLDLFLRYLDEATKKGADLPTTKNADYRDKFNYFIDAAQIYIAGLVKIPAVLTVTQYDPNDENYTGIFEYAMPADFYSFDSIIFKRDSKNYESYTNYRWLNNKRIVLGVDDIGTFDIHYFAYPSTILPTDPDETPMSVEDKAVELVALQAGIRATAADNEDLSQYLQKIFNNLAPNIISDYKTGDSKVQTVYSIM